MRHDNGVAPLAFLHPWLLLGLGAVLAPVLIHLVGRQRAPEVRFAAFDFLAQAHAHLAQRERLRQVLLLLLRCLAVLAWVLALARPSTTPERPVELGVKRLAVVVDASASMAYSQGGRSLWTEAQAQVDTLMRHLQPADSVFVVVAGPEVRSLLPAPSSDHAAIRRALAELQPAGGADLGAAMVQALAPFGNDGTGLTLALISDLAQGSCAGLRPSGMAPLPLLRLVDVAQRQPLAALPNLGIESVRIERSPGHPLERRLRVLVRNWGAAPAQQVPLVLSIAGQVVQRSYVDVPAQSAQEKLLTHAFPAAGTFLATAQLAAGTDGFPSDDGLDFVVDVPRELRVLAVNGAPRSIPHADELFFVERALGTLPEGDAPIGLRIVAPQDLSAAPEVLAASDVVILANVGELAPAQVAALASFVDAGGGLLIGLGDGVAFERANVALAPLLPHPLRDVHLAADAAAASPALAFGEMDWEHPLLRDLGPAFEASLRATRTRRYFNLDVGMASRARPLLRFDNGASALVEARPQASRRGRVLLWTSSLDVDDTDLPLRPAFPPLLQRMIRHLAQVEAAGPTAGVRVGDALSLPLPTGATALALEAPDGSRQEARPEGTRTLVLLGPLSQPGLHRLLVQRGDWRPMPQFDVAVGPSLRESDFAPMPVASIAAALGAPATALDPVGGSARSPFEERGQAAYALLGLILLLLGEGLLAARG